MKKVVLILFTGVLLASCGNENKAVEATDQQGAAQVEDSAVAVNYNVATDASVLNWKGSKMLGSFHVGTVGVKGGVLTIENGELKGSVIVDLTSIKNTDVTDEKKNSDLVGHLKSPDFFWVDSFSTAQFVISSAIMESDSLGNTHKISGDLTLKGVTKNITFPAKVQVDESSVNATGTVVINRLDWGVNFHSDKVTSFIGKTVSKAKDDFVKNEIELQLNIVAKK